jgi:diguanylate cyclase (GGDEF)-like protein
VQADSFAAGTKILNQQTPDADDGLWPLLEQFYDGVLLVAANPWRVVRANATAAKWLGQALNELVGRSIGELFVAESKDAVVAQLENELRGDSSDGPILVKLAPAHGPERLVGLRVCRVVSDGSVALGVWLYSVQKSHEYWSRMDPLTGQRDRSFLEMRLRELLHGAQTSKRQFAVLFIDLDNFKDVNDRYGHLVGDRVLREAARRLAACVGKDDHVVRYGGDEFVVLVENASDATKLEALVADIRKAVAMPIALPEGEVRLSVSIGTAVSSPEFRMPDEMLAAADRAMYAAKRERM